MDLTQELRAEAEKNEHDPRVLVEILKELVRWRGGPTLDLELWIIDRLAPHVEPRFSIPDTDAFPGEEPLDTDDWPAEGLLGKLHYSVRKNGLTTYQRRVLLDSAYKADASEYLPADEAVSWGAPASAKRVQKMVRSLAHFIRNAKRRKDANMKQAIAKWEEDLSHLKDTFESRFKETSWPKLQDHERGDDAPPDLFGG